MENDIIVEYSDIILEYFVRLSNHIKDKNENINDLIKKLTR